jgi:hypothetical protein
MPKLRRANKMDEDNNMGIMAIVTAVFLALAMFMPIGG